MAPLVPMHTLGHDFIPPGIHAGGLRYHGMAPLVSHAHEPGLIRRRGLRPARLLRGGRRSSRRPRASCPRRSRARDPRRIDAARRAEERARRRSSSSTSAGTGTSTCRPTTTSWPAVSSITRCPKPSWSARSPGSPTSRRPRREPRRGGRSTRHTMRRCVPIAAVTVAALVAVAAPAAAKGPFREGSTTRLALVPDRWWGIAYAPKAPGLPFVQATFAMVHHPESGVGGPVYELHYGTPGRELVVRGEMAWSGCTDVVPPCPLRAAASSPSWAARRICSTRPRLPSSSCKTSGCASAAPGCRRPSWWRPPIRCVPCVRRAAWPRPSARRAARSPARSRRCLRAESATALRSPRRQRCVPAISRHRTGSAAQSQRARPARCPRAHARAGFDLGEPLVPLRGRRAPGRLRRHRAGRPRLRDDAHLAAHYGSLSRCSNAIMMRRSRTFRLSRSGSVRAAEMIDSFAA